MSVDIPADLVPFVQAVISSGRCRTETEVVGEALRVFQELESRRRHLRDNMQEGIDSGESISGEEVFDRLERRAPRQAARRE